MKNLKSYILLAVTAILLISCTEKEDISNATFSIKLDHNANIGDVLYDGAGNGFTLSKLTYFVTDIVLQKSNGDKVAVDNEIGATIIDLENAAEGGAIVYNDILGVEKGNYTSVSFKIGVSEDIFSEGEEAQGRILTLANENGGDMIWSWTTGYIFAKIEGELTGTTGVNGEEDDDHTDHTHKLFKTTSTNHNGTDHDLEGTAFMRHVGNTGAGDSRTDRVRTITLDFNGQEVVVGNVDSSIHLKVDVAKFLDATEKIDVATDPNAMTESTTEIADNLEDVFSFDHKH